MPGKSKVRKKLTKREQRDLDIEIDFIEGVVKRDPTNIEALRVLGDDYTRRGHFQNGLKIDKQLAQLRPRDPMVLYNLACSYSLTGQSDRAIVILEKAIHAGYTDFRWLWRDPDLASVRAHPSFAKLRAKLRAVKVRTE